MRLALDETSCIGIIAEFQVYGFSINFQLLHPRGGGVWRFHSSIPFTYKFGLEV